MNTLTAKELLLDWTTGQGATGKTPDLFTNVTEGKLQGVPVSLSLLTAIAEYKTIGSPDSFREAISRGYLSANHQSQHEKATTVKKEKVLPGHYKTAAEFETDSKKEYALLLGTRDEVYTALASISDKMAKSEILDIVHSLLGTIPPERQAAIEEAYRKEEVVRSAVAELGAYLDDVQIISDTQLTGRYKTTLTPTESKTFARLLTESYADFKTTSVNAVLTGFEILEPAYVKVTVTLK